jgi:hypothetical protein
MFPWAKFRQAKGGVKAHVLLDHDDYLPRYVLVTEARRSDVKMTDAFPLNPGSIVAMDRGYNDCALFGKWTDEKIYVVTRLKDNFAIEQTIQTKDSAKQMVWDTKTNRILLFAADFMPPTGPPRAGVAGYGGKMVPDSFSILVVTK